MTQNELILSLLKNYREYSQLEPMFGSNPSYINDPMEYISDRIKEEYDIDLASMKDTSKVYNCLDDISVELYSNALFTGFQTGFDMAMVLLGKKPIYDVLPDSNKQDRLPDNGIDSRTEEIASNVTELVKVAGADKVAQLIHSLGYGSVAEMIVETEKES